MTSLIRLGLAGNDSFWPCARWVADKEGKSFCRHCRNVYSTKKEVDAVVVNADRSTDLDAIGFECGGVHIFSERMISLIGEDLLGKTGILGRVIDRSGTEIKTHRTVKARYNNTILRGSPESVAGLCKECGRVMYSPVGEEYVLWKEIREQPFFLSWIYAFCTHDFYESTIKPAALTRIEVFNIHVQDSPSDALPLLTNDLADALREAGMFK